MTKNWQPHSWRSHEARQLPTYRDADALAAQAALQSRHHNADGLDRAARWREPARQRTPQPRLLDGGKHALHVPVEATVCIFSTAAKIETRVQMWVRGAWVMLGDGVDPRTDSVYEVGEEVRPGVRVTAIDANGVTLTYKGATRTLSMSAVPK